MAKLSTQQIRQDLINQKLSECEDFINLIAKEFERELVSYWSQAMSPDGVDKMLALARLNPTNMITHFYFSKSDKWLRAQHKIDFPKVKEVA
jgi:hypothetical protein